MHVFSSVSTFAGVVSRSISARARITTLLVAVSLSTAGMAQRQGAPSGNTSDDKFPLSDPLTVAASRWDENKDGILTCDEWKHFVVRMFSMADKNHDGFLDAKEFAGLRRAEPTFADADMSYFDDNRNSKVSKAEFVDKPNPFFLRYDLNHDCRVTPDEIKNAGKAPAQATKPGMGGRGKMGGGGGMGGMGLPGGIGSPGGQ